MQTSTRSSDTGRCTGKQNENPNCRKDNMEQDKDMLRRISIIEMIGYFDLKVEQQLDFISHIHCWVTLETTTTIINNDYNAAVTVVRTQHKLL